MTGVVVGAHGDDPVRRELGGVDEDPPADGVDLLGQAVHRLDHAGHVGRATDGQQRDAAGEAAEVAFEIVLVQRAVGSGADVHDLGPGPPREVVGVVLEQRREHHRVVGHRHRRAPGC